MEYKYWLPSEHGEKQEYITSNNSVIIIGANGAGKSKLGAWIEQQNFEEVHRIGAQRNLNFNENISLKSYSQAEGLVFYGSDDRNSEKVVRWNWGQSYTTMMLNDFENVLAALIALKNNENDAFVEECKKSEKENKNKPQTPITSIDKLQSIWNSVFPQRKLRLDDSKFYAVLTAENGEEIYSANQMSDGERSILYLAAQVLCVPANKILIIDEPELHLHRSIMNKLWKALEECRKDCLFIYITHDTEFAAFHMTADKIWIKEFNGSNWILEKIDNDILPDDLLLDILGSRKDVLFVEGERGSYDTELYTVLYPQYHVIPCGSCTQVIARTKVFNANTNLHHCKVYGIIDRDFRSDYEIEGYSSDNIFTINVAEVENLFLVEELIRIMANHMGKNENDVFNQVSKYVINDRFSNQINGQICQCTVAEIKYILSTINISKKNEAEAKDSLNSVWNSLNYESIKSQQEAKFLTALQEKNYKNVIKVFNEKGIAKSIGHYFGIKNSEYCSIVVALATGEKKDAIINALSQYLPDGIPR